MKKKKTYEVEIVLKSKAHAEDFEAALNSLLDRHTRVMQVTDPRWIVIREEDSPC